MARGGPDIGKRPDKIVRENAPPPDEPIGTAHTMMGTIKWWNAAKGYGAIAIDKTTPWDIWFHFSHIDDVVRRRLPDQNAFSGFRSPTPGEAVEVDFYRVDQDSFKYVARSVRRLSSSSESEDEG